MRTAALALTAILSLAAMAPAVQAQNTRSEEIPGNKPISTYSQENRTYVRRYVRDRTVPNVDYTGQIVIGSQVSPTITMHTFEGDETYTNYRYGRLNNRYVVVDQAGRIVDVIE